MPDDFRAVIASRLDQLDAEDAAGRGDRAPVTLDQQSVGRLSRMDAMQRQAMAEAQQRRRQQERARLQAALKRLDAGEFGYCLRCGDEIEPERLATDPAIAVCMTCMKGG